ncbi:MAG: response regulator, partial [Planctomycetota bacterium]|nr:response regulator [Planctomycetota bacterium]
PFFTTKSEHDGSGLGLATVWWVLERSQGHLDLTTSSSEGTIFRIYLPSVLSEIPSMEVEQKVDAPAHPSARILLVEDNHSVRQLVQRILSGAGYEVTPAEHAAHALRLVEESGDPFDMLLTDLVMPGMHGTELAEKLRQQEPGLPVIFMSGYDRRSATGLNENGTLGTMLSKPFKPAALLDCVQRELSSN